MKTIVEFITQHDITMTFREVEAQTDFQKEFQGATHWKCTLRMGKKRMTADYSMGAAYSHRTGPALSDVLGCLAMDISWVGEGISFEDFCSRFGYDTDSRKAEKIYNDCRKISAKLENFLGKESLAVLLNETERL